MKRILAILAAGVLAMAPLDARAQQAGRQDVASARDSIIDVYVTRLDMTDKQHAAILDILESQGQKASEMMATARTGGREAMRAMRPDILELQKETDALVEEHLTEEQIPEYRTIRAEMDAQRRERRRRQSGRP